MAQMKDVDVDVQKQAAIADMSNDLIQWLRDCEVFDPNIADHTYRECFVSFFNQENSAGAKVDWIGMALLNNAALYEARRKEIKLKRENESLQSINTAMQQKIDSLKRTNEELSEQALCLHEGPRRPGMHFDDEPVDPRTGPVIVLDVTDDPAYYACLEDAVKDRPHLIHPQDRTDVYTLGEKLSPVHTPVTWEFAKGSESS